MIGYLINLLFSSRDRASHSASRLGPTRRPPYIRDLESA